MMKKLIAAAAVAALTAVSGASAQQDAVSNPRGIVANFDPANVGPILTELGAVWQQRQAPDGRPYIAVSAGGELSFNIIPTACQGPDFTNCVGMNSVVLFAGSGFNHQTVTAFNQRYWFSTAGLAEDGRSAYLSRYEIADYGIARGNVAASILNLVALADIFRDELRTSAQTIAHEGYAEDLSARLLNSRGLAAMAGAAGETPVTRHQGAMEETAELVRVLLRDRDAPRNKIENIGAER
ncbi:YbjN domain-containing protein [Amphiplicatus metriothermophilus]|uniref:Uncharacterized protein n=1 Tax=Amphiplicatus metriothermophilus TaxID=1519374 RepID=A0A239PLY6_9PROT|nr:YbjN domain-containing protein [Amphiplicatus metriothermophilus]MBB5517291.1 hypothetical protein [Amphiplicatus metriothermophilus]SNT68373.1 hypothetical protein SAMN06297382_0875 [Amphiplicatus metriothermophilus]